MTHEQAPFDLKMAHCRIALAIFDTDKPRRDALLEAAVTQVLVDRWQETEDHALHTLRLAFHEDTKDRNNLAGAMCVDVGFVRQLVTESVRVFGEDNGDAAAIAVAVANATKSYQDRMKQLLERHQCDQTALDNMTQLAPDVGDLVECEGKQYRVDNWLRALPEPLQRDMDAEFITAEADTFNDALRLILISATQRVGPDNKRLAWCTREEAEYVEISSGYGTIRRVGDVKVVGRIGWSDEVIEEHRQNALRLVGEVIF